MTNLTDDVRDYLNKNPAIVKAIGLKIVNVRALAFYVMKELKIDVSVHAVMSAIRRYEKPSNSKNNQSTVNMIYSDSKISTKSHLALVQVKRHFDVLKNIIPTILDLISVSRGEVLRIFEGRESIKFVVDHSKIDEILKIIPKSEIIDTDDDLGEINLHLSEKYGDMPGMIAPILNELALNNINIVEVIGCMPELIIIVKEKDISQSHDALLKFLYGKK
jgi:hypothetical protein